jgi:hypothetical protein
MDQHWNAVPSGVIKVFEALGYIVKSCGPGPMKIYFTVSRSVSKYKDRGDIIEILKRKQPNSESDMESSLQKIVDKWWERNRKWLERGFDNGDSRNMFQRSRTNELRKNRGLDLYIFTDGVWSSPAGPFGLCGVDTVVNDTSAKLRKENRPANTIYFHFIHFGQDPCGSARMQMLLDVKS